VLRSRSNAAAVLVVSNSRASIVATRAVSAVVDVGRGGGLIASGGAGEEGSLKGVGASVAVSVSAGLEVTTAGGRVSVVLAVAVAVEGVGRVGVGEVVHADELDEPGRWEGEEERTSAAVKEKEEKKQANL
jgi:hypothetical protein